MQIALICEYDGGHVEPQPSCAWIAFFDCLRENRQRLVHDPFAVPTRAGKMRNLYRDVWRYGNDLVEKDECLGAPI